MAPARMSAGFTLVELMITLSILAIVTSLAVPSFNDMIRRNKRVACGNELVGALQFGRTEAVRVGRPVTVTAPNGIEQGVVVYRDDNGDGNVDNDEILQQTAACDVASLEVTTGDIEFSYLADGQTNMADNFVLEICDATAVGEQGRNIRILTSGVLRTARLECD
ncbi:GspH/FimT family pseudopilin [Microbulbifer sp. SA54]|uniref:GspH/FimT family pseudopilin n=1 Tax=Microbulbifer sp. SA54 TaxID=3401577 RepID=UPI003AACFBCF